MNRIDHTISIVGNASNPATRAVSATVPLRYDPSPPAARNGRLFLYDARRSGHGDSACASCHIFGDFDSLAWDLGDPFGTVVNNPNPFRVPKPSGSPVFHPMKGPMTTQSLRGMADPAGPMHWRGDRTGGNDSGGDALAEVGPDHGPRRALELGLQARPAAAGQRCRSPDRGDEDLVCERPRQGERQSALHGGERRARPVQRPAEDPAAGELPALRARRPGALAGLRDGPGIRAAAPRRSGAPPGRCACEAPKRLRRGGHGAIPGACFGVCPEG